ncbi:unnamed protein product [Heterobilharzia americana]|nr:unnamed protein product [Heterobilharzia americana]
MLDFPVRDRKAICQAEDEKGQAMKQAQLLSSKEALITARRQAYEHREARLMEIGQRLQLRHEQIKARRKATETAEQVKQSVTYE